MEPLRVGDVLHGFCGGAFGRDHYYCSRVEAVGGDWVVVREIDSSAKSLWFSTLRPEQLAKYRDAEDCPCYISDDYPD